MPRRPFPAPPTGRADAGSGAAPPPCWQELVAGLNEETGASSVAAFERAERPGPRAFLWAPLVRALSAFRRAPAGEKRVTSLVEGYRSLVHAAKLWDLERRWRESSGVRFEEEGATILCAPGWAWTVRRILHGDLGGEPLRGGRGGTRRIATGLGSVVYRECRRGGAVRWLGSLYLGFRPRPFREYWTMLTARRLGLPVPEPIAGIVTPVVPGAYRGAILTLEVEGAVPLWEHLRAGADDDPIGRLAAALRRIHDAGLRHPDLNLGNVLVTAAGEIVFVDLDRASIRPGGLGDRDRARALGRIRRSARKLDPAGAVLGDADLDRLERSYRAAR